MAKRGHKANKDKASQSSNIQATAETEVLKPSDVDKVVKPADTITKYFPTSSKMPPSQTSIENIAGVLTPETTPTKENPKTTGTQKTHSSTTAEKQTQGETTDSPEHKKTVPNKVTTEKKSGEENTRVTAATTGGEGGDKKSSSGKGKGQKKEQGAKRGKQTKSGRSRKPRSTKEPSVQTMTLKDYFPVRRSSRRCKSEIEAEQKKDLEDAILTVREEGMKVSDILGKGRGVVSTKAFRSGDFVVEYYGDLIDTKEAKKREAEYMKDTSVGCYMYYFQFKNKQYCVDATRESGRLGRLLNHSKSGNCCTKLVDVKGTPHLVIVASRDIAEGEELLYDYGDRNKESLQAHPWLAL